MQPAPVDDDVSSSTGLRGMTIAALAMAIATGVASSPAQAYGTPLIGIVTAISAPIDATRAAVREIDHHWQHASYLAWAIEHRRYDEISVAAAAVDDASPYARWVPAAIGLAVEQLDATAAAYGYMGRCGDLSRFLGGIERGWPAGRAAMRPVSCESPFVCGTGKREMARWFGGIAAYRAVRSMQRMERFTQRAVEIDRAATAGDHARALSSCAAIGHDGPMLPACVAEACRAGELAIAEVLLPHADAQAITACVDAGVTFVGGFARTASSKQPVELVHVHPDAPPRFDATW